MKSNVLRIGPGKISEVELTLREAGISGVIMYVFDPHVEELYGSIVRPQIEAVGRIKEQLVDYNTIAYAMDVAERVIATDINCVTPK